MSTQALELPPTYTALLASLQERIRSAQARAALAVNRELVLLYWQIGRKMLIQKDSLPTIEELEAELTPDPEIA